MARTLYGPWIATGALDPMSKKPSQSPGVQLKAYVAPFRFDGSGAFHLKSHKTDAKGGLDKDKAEKIFEANRKRLNDFQEKLYAQDRWSLLLIFQGMDAAGKDSAIKSTVSYTHLRAHETRHDLVCRLLLEKK